MGKSTAPSWKGYDGMVPAPAGTYAIYRHGLNLIPVPLVGYLVRDGTVGNYLTFGSDAKGRNEPEMIQFADGRIWKIGQAKLFEPDGPESSQEAEEKPGRKETWLELDESVEYLDLWECRLRDLPFKGGTLQTLLPTEYDRELKRVEAQDIKRLCDLAGRSLTFINGLDPDFIGFMEGMMLALGVSTPDFKDWERKIAPEKHRETETDYLKELV